MSYGQLRSRHLYTSGRYQEAIEAADGEIRLQPADDELFLALRSQSMSAADPAPLRRYLQVLPDGRHVADLPKWFDKLAGIDAVWVRDTP